MSRAIRYSGLTVVGCAFVLSLLVSISLPFFKAMDIVRIVGDNKLKDLGVEGLGPNEIRLGIWSVCNYLLKTECSKAGSAYTFEILSADLNGNGISKVTIGSSWTRGLAVHPVAAGMSLIAFALSFANGLTLILIASVASLLAALVNLIAFAIDIALLAYVRHKVGQLSTHDGIHVNTSAGFWLTFVSVILSLIGAVLVFLGYRKKHSSSWDAPKLFSKFRK